jgi:hypothetical protein
LSSRTAIELVLITVLVAVEGPSEEGGFGVAGGGLFRSWAKIELVEKMQPTPINAYNQTLMLTPIYPFCVV